MLLPSFTHYVKARRKSRNLIRFTDAENDTGGCASFAAANQAAEQIDVGFVQA